MDNTKKKNLGIFREVLANILLACLYGLFAYRFFIDFQMYGRFSSLILLVFETVVIVFFLIRRRPMSLSTSSLEWVCAIIGTYLVFLFRPAEIIHDALALQILQMTGLFIAIISLLFLGRSFGIIPANRGVQSKGMYRLVRHPMYAGYVLMYMSFVLQNFTFYNIMVFSVFVFFKVIRILMEEDHLSNDQAYQEVKEKVRSRLIPFVW